ncbi:MAG: DUF6283 family protein [Renibacterium salmoninarum]|nr:DUF6283 family protein [Renibacterium salmoninarum]
MSEENKPNREPRKPRVKPCASCPYRSGVPARIWEESEYRKLPGYDEPMPLQPQSLFLCHQGDGDVCAGWLGHRDPADLLAVRLGIASGVLDPDCCTYATDVPLYSTGQEAAAHGMSGPPMPDPTAQSAIKKIQAKRATRQPKE